MNEFNVDVATADGQMDCFIAHPDTSDGQSGPFPAVILYMDVPGVREELRDFIRLIAAQGYFAVLPDMYYRDGKVRFDLTKGMDELQRMFAQGQKLNVPGVMSDTAGLLDYLDANATVKSPHGCIGYCMSGQYVVAAAGTYPDHFAAIASLYGVGIVTDHPKSPHLVAANAKGELYLGFAEEDQYVEDNVIPDLKASLDAGDIDYVIETHAGTEHGFCFPGRPSYDKEAAERVWEIVFDLYARKLK